MSNKKNQGAASHQNSIRFDWNRESCQPMSTFTRRSAFGRVPLYHADPNDTLHVCEYQSTASVICASTFHRYHTITPTLATCCWHCCHPFQQPEPPQGGIKIPRIYDCVSDVYHVYGTFCSLSCAKAYIYALPSPYDRIQQMRAFTHMHTRFYGVEDVPCAPSREALQMFGGPFSIETFRGTTHPCVTKSPPFVSHAMIVEERMHEPTLAPDVASVRGIRAMPPTPSQSRIPDGTLVNRYGAFCAEKVDAAAQSTTTAPKRRRGGGESVREGKLAAFMIQRRQAT